MFVIFFFDARASAIIGRDVFAVSERPVAAEFLIVSGGVASGIDPTAG